MNNPITAVRIIKKSCLDPIFATTLSLQISEGRPNIKINNEFICQIQNYIINVYLSNNE